MRWRRGRWREGGGERQAEESRAAVSLSGSSCDHGRRVKRARPLLPLLLLHAVTMAQPSPCASPGIRRRSDGSVRESLFFPVSERNEQERLEALVRRRAGGSDRRGGGEAREYLDNRPKRWTWGGPPDGVEGEYHESG